MSVGISGWISFKITWKKCVRRIFALSQKLQKPSRCCYLIYYCKMLRLNPIIVKNVTTFSFVILKKCQTWRFLMVLEKNPEIRSISILDNILFLVICNLVCDFEHFLSFFRRFCFCITKWSESYKLLTTLKKKEIKISVCLARFFLSKPLS